MNVQQHYSRHIWLWRTELKERPVKEGLSWLRYHDLPPGRYFVEATEDLDLVLTEEPVDYYASMRIWVGSEIRCGDSSMLREYIRTRWLDVDISDDLEIRVVPHGRPKVDISWLVRDVLDDIELTLSMHGFEYIRTTDSILIIPGLMGLFATEELREYIGSLITLESTIDVPSFTKLGIFSRRFLKVC